MVKKAIYNVEEMKVTKGDPKLFKFYKSEFAQAPIFDLEEATIEEVTTVELKTSDYVLNYVYSDGKFELALSDMGN